MRLFHVGAQNDALFIISGERPASTSDYPRHDADRTCIAKVVDQAEADRLVAAANRGLEASPGAESFQARVRPWMLECFGPAIAADTAERNHRFMEEAVELVQACGCTRDAAHVLVDYVYARPVGERAQEVGGVLVTLAALCLAQDLDMDAAGEAELARVWTMIEKIRAKQAAKPKHSPLPGRLP